MQIYKNITEIIGGTPLVRLNRLPQQYGCVAEIVLKLESLNPAKSVKDRISISMVAEAERSGLLKPGESTISIPLTSEPHCNRLSDQKPYTLLLVAY